MPLETMKPIHVLMCKGRHLLVFWEFSCHGEQWIIAASVAKWFMFATVACYVAHTNSPVLQLCQVGTSFLGLSCPSALIDSLAWLKWSDMLNNQVTDCGGIQGDIAPILDSDRQSWYDSHLDVTIGVFFILLYNIIYNWSWIALRVNLECTLPKLKLNLEHSLLKGSQPLFILTFKTLLSTKISEVYCATRVV